MEEVVEINRRWRHWHYKNTFFLILTLVIFFLLADTPWVKQFVTQIGSLGYIGAFFVGMLFVSIFTVAPASVALFYLAESLDPFGIAIAAGAGSMIGDYLILRFLRDRVFEELKPIYMHHGGKPLQHLFKTPYFAWAVPIIGSIIIMSPFPDEVGLGLMGVSRLKTWQLLGFLYLLDVTGIFLIVMAAKSF